MCTCSPAAILLSQKEDFIPEETPSHRAIVSGSVSIATLPLVRNLNFFFFPVLCSFVDCVRVIV